MAKQDYYETLGVARDADAAALKRAFRNLAKQHHPDRNPGDESSEQKFKQVNEAYEALKDPQKRAAYDQFGHAAFDGSAGPGGMHGFSGDFSSSMSDIFDDLFGEFMGSRRGGPRTMRERGADLRYNLEISLREAYDGKSAQIRVPSSINCAPCAGSGARPGTSPGACRTCGGSGWIEILGAGMVHPEIIANAGYDPERYTGFAWGMGVERIAMLRHGIDDIRLFYANDIRFLQQF